jgi:protein gp37
VSKIQWTEKTWNPLVGCSKASAGCKHCYAERDAPRVLRRLEVVAKSGGALATVNAYRKALNLEGKTPRWSGRAVPMPHKLMEPMRWSKPTLAFVNSMSDLFHPTVQDTYIATVFGVMAATPQHTYQVLTKHPDRASRWFDEGRYARESETPWPLPNVWLGTSVEDQATADSRIPHLLACPAAVRWVSYEPALGPVDFWPFFSDSRGDGPRCNPDGSSALGWVVVGGESGPNARPFDPAWAQGVIGQCHEAGVPAFVKQMGSAPVGMALKCRKGGDMEEWPEALRVRQYPGRLEGTA